MNGKSRPHLRAVFSLFLLTACAPAEPLNLSEYSRLRETPERFAICHGYGCEHKTRVRLSDEEWQRVTAPLTTAAATAEEERGHIAEAIAEMEKVVGAKTNTANDQAGATFSGYGSQQLDCIDETVNTALYLRLFAAKRLLKWHELAEPARRGEFIDGAWPHNTAVIREKASGNSYTVDSWFGKNGEKPHIVPLNTWLSGWKPY